MICVCAHTSAYHVNVNVDGRGSYQAFQKLAGACIVLAWMSDFGLSISLGIGFQRAHKDLSQTSIHHEASHFPVLWARAYMKPARSGGEQYHLLQKLRWQSWMRMMQLRQQLLLPALRPRPDQVHHPTMYNGDWT